MDYLEFSEEPLEFEEIVELIPCEAEPSEDANFFMDQGKPRCTNPIYFQKLLFMSPINGYFRICVLSLGVD